MRIRMGGMRVFIRIREGIFVFGTVGGNEKSADTDRGIAGQKKGKHRANAVFVDTHGFLVKKSPMNMFTLEMD